jgi:sugar diacid utilization regulator
MQTSEYIELFIRSLVEELSTIYDGGKIHEITREEYIKQGVKQSAAEIAHIVEHPKTLEYRLERLEQHTHSTRTESDYGRNYTVIEKPDLY